MFILPLFPLYRLHPLKYLSHNFSWSWKDHPELRIVFRYSSPTLLSRQIVFESSNKAKYHVMFSDLFRNSKYSSKNFQFFVLGTTVPTLNYLRVATAQGNYLHSFLSLIRKVFEFISKFKIFIRKLTLFWKNRHGYSFIVPSLEYFLVVIALFNLVHIFSLSILRKVLEYISKFQILFEKYVIFHVRAYIIIRMGKEYLSTFKSLKAEEKARSHLLWTLKV